RVRGEMEAEAAAEEKVREQLLRCLHDDLTESSGFLEGGTSAETFRAAALRRQVRKDQVRGALAALPAARRAAWEESWQAADALWKAVMNSPAGKKARDEDLERQKRILTPSLGNK